MTQLPVAAQDVESASPSTAKRTVFIGSFVHSVSLNEIEYIPLGVVCVKEGVIEWIEQIGSTETGKGVEEVLMSHGISEAEDREDTGLEVEVIRGEEGEIWVPGLVDTHTHAPQFPNIGLGNGVQLLDWLEQLTFPEEEKYGDVDYARGVYEGVVSSTLKHGTTTCCYYGTTHAESTTVLADICYSKGQRAFVGKCCMDRHCPSTYVESTSSSISSTESYISHFDKYPSTPLPALVQPILTPRFAISCTPDLLSSLSTIASSHTPSLAIQTHMSENKLEVKVAKELFPGSKTYAGIYEKYGLLGEGTILAHCVHLDDDEREVIKRNGAGVSHCPSSNFNLNSGLAEVQKLLDVGIKVGLGTDCSGGSTPSILQNIRVASQTSKSLCFLHPLSSSSSSSSSSSTTPLSLETLFHMATIGGASLVRMQDKIGNFQAGKEFDALRIKLAGGAFPVVGGSSPAKEGSGEVNGHGEDGRDPKREMKEVKRVFEKWIWAGDDRDINEVWVRGTRVAG